MFIFDNASLSVSLKDLRPGDVAPATPTDHSNGTTGDKEGQQSSNNEPVKPSKRFGTMKICDLSKLISDM